MGNQFLPLFPNFFILQADLNIELVQFAHHQKGYKFACLLIGVQFIKLKIKDVGAPISSNFVRFTGHISLHFCPFGGMKNYTNSSEHF